MHRSFIGALAVVLGLIMVAPVAAVSAVNDSYGSTDSDSAVVVAAPAGYLPVIGAARKPPTGPLHIATTKRTNIVVIMVDDLAEMGPNLWNHLPALKAAFVDQGIEFTNYFGNDPLCCPGRAGFLTGQYTDHHGVWTNDATLLDPSETVATELRGVGYDTIISGKYLNNMDALVDKTPKGWTQSAIFAGGYYRYRAWVNGVYQYHGSTTADYSPDVFTNQALQFMRNTPANKPIFAFLTPYDVHEGPDQNGKDPGWNMPVTAPRYEKAANASSCQGIGNYNPPSYDEADVSDKPAYIKDEVGLVASHYPDGWPLHPICTSLLAVNDEFVRVKAELKAEGRLNKTLFVLTGDNGMAFGAHGWPKKDVPYAEQLPLYVYWPAGRGTTQTTSAAYIANVDAAPTLCEVGGCVMGPYPNGQKTSDGQSFLGLIVPNRSSSVPVRDALYQEHRTEDAPRYPFRDLRTTDQNPLGLWQYVVYDNGECELYDLTNDPWELNNVCNQFFYLVIQAQLATRLASFVTHVKPGVP